MTPPRSRGAAVYLAFTTTKKIDCGESSLPRRQRLPGRSTGEYRRKCEMGFGDDAKIAPSDAP